MARGRSKKEQEAAAPSPRVTAASRYAALESERSPFLQRARDCAELTIPGLMPPEGTSGATVLYQPYQSIGARGVNNLGAKLLLALFPPGGSFYRNTVDDSLVEMMERAEAKQEIEQALAEMERRVMKRLEEKGTRLVLFETLKHLIVTGNALLQVLPDGALKMHRLDRYVVKRDHAGNVLDIVVKETLSRATVPEKVRAIVERHSGDVEKDKVDAKSVDLYTRVWRDGRTWRVYQEVCGEIIPGTEGTYPLDKCAWLPLRWSSISGEDYGRGHCEEYYGDLRSLEALRKAIIEFSAGAAKTLFMVNESGLTDAEELARADNLSFVQGDAKDVTVLRIEKFADFRVTKETYDEVKQSLMQAFLLLTEVRNAERVTAEEIRTIVAELEASLGGVYSVLAQELQAPLASRVTHQMQKEGSLPSLPEGVVKTQIITGLDGLGRSSDLAKMTLGAQTLNQTFGPETAGRVLKMGTFARNLWVALGLNPDTDLHTDEELQAQAQAAQQAELAGKLGPTVVKESAAMLQAGNQPAAAPSGT